MFKTFLNTGYAIENLFRLEIPAKSDATLSL
jgi:hypothetical protein